MKFFSKFTIIPLILVMVFGIYMAGCGGGDKNDADSGVTTIRFWHAMGGPLGEILVDMIKDFNKTHPHIRVIEENLASYENLEKKLLASLIAKNNPDIAQMYEAVTLKMAKAGKLLELGPMIEAQGDFDTDDIIPTMLDDVTFDGKIWALPFNKSLPVLYYNKDSFKKAGLDPEAPPKNWDEFLEYAKKLTLDTNGDGRIDEWGTAFPAENAWVYFCMVLQFGGKLYDYETNMVKMDSPEAIEALEYLVDSIHKHKVAYTSTGFNHQNDFLAGTVAMIMSSVVSKSFMEDKITFDWGMVPIPQGKLNASILSGTNASIFTTTPEREKASWEFLNWFSKAENTARWSLGTTYMPVRQSAIDGPIMQAAFEEDSRNLAAVSQLPYSSFEPRMAGWYNCRKITGSLLEEAMIGKRPAADILKEGVREMNDFLSKELQ